jgi:tetratricopeptide (TPR) repeat protein
VKDVEQDYLKRISELLQSGGADGQIIARAVQLAQTAADHTVKEHPRDVYGYLLVAQLDTMLGYYDGKYIDQAEWAYSKAAELSPKRQQIYYSWGRLRLARRDYAGALEVLQKALNDNPRISDSHWYVGLTYYMSGDKENAKREIDEAIKLNYQWKSAYEPSLVGDLYFDVKDYATAIIYYKKAISQGAQGETFYHLAKTYAALGDKAKALKYATKSLETIADNLKPEVNQFLAGL